MSLRKDNVIEEEMELLIAYGPEKFKESMELIFNLTMQIERSRVYCRQNAQSYVPGRSLCERGLKYIFDSRDGKRSREAVAVIVKKYEQSAPEFSRWLEENIEEALTVFLFPEKHRRLIRTVNGIERLNEEIKRRTRVAGIFPNPQSCLRLITAVLVEKNDVRMTGRKYMNFDVKYENLNYMPFYRKYVASSARACLEWHGPKRKPGLNWCLHLLITSRKFR